MDYYLDLKIEPDEEVPIFFIRNKIYTKLHKALHTLNANDIGVSFPNYKLKLGDVIRIHASESRLNELQATNWLGGLKGYCEVGEIKPVPDDVQYRIVSRKQSTMTAAKLKRLIKRGSINDEEAKQYKAKMFTKGLSNPYLELKSTSSGNNYRRYIQFSELLENSRAGEFDHFGLSKTATISWF